MSLFEQLLKARGLDGPSRKYFLNPDYQRLKHDPFLLPDMQAAVDRLVVAHDKQEKITIYGDYDIDGLTATTLLVDALASFGFQQVETFMPNRFVEGYGLTVEAVEKIAASGADLIVTVDCGSLSEKEIVRAGQLGVDVIVTDHHNVAPVQPPAVAVVNPKRLLQDYPEAYQDFILDSPPPSSQISEKSARRSLDAGPVGASVAHSVSDELATPDAVGSRHSDSAESSLSPAELAKAQTSSSSQDNSAESHGLTKASVAASSSSVTEPLSTTYQLPPTNLYPFLDLAGVGVAFKLVQALQTKLDGLPIGQEKWLLDLVALGTVCDVVTLRDENRANVHWGLKVMSKTRRPGLKALMAVAGVEPEKLNSRSLGFALGPRMNASGRLETAQHSLDMLLATDSSPALEVSQQLDELNRQRRSQQDEILKQAIAQAETYQQDQVLVLSAPDWNHGIIGIVAAKILEKYKKPTYVLQEMGQESKGSARSYGDFSAVDAIRASDDVITKGGGHKLAAGVTLPTANIDKFRTSVNQFYRSKNLLNQAALLLPTADVSVDSLDQINQQLLDQLDQLEPFGNGNPEPVFRGSDLLVLQQRRMGAEAQHVKLELQDSTKKTMQFLAFNAPDNFFAEPGEMVNVWFQSTINEWRGQRSIEGRILHLENVAIQ